jgi:hypothetical protein
MAADFRAVSGSGILNNGQLHVLASFQTRFRRTAEKSHR